MTCYEAVWFSSKREFRVLRIALESPFTDGNHGTVKTERCDVAAWSQLKHQISKTVAPIIVQVFFYVHQVYFDRKFVGWSLTNWRRKRAPAVHQCFENQRHWIFAFWSCVEPNNQPRNYFRRNVVIVSLEQLLNCCFFQASACDGFIQTICNNNALSSISVIENSDITSYLKLALLSGMSWWCNTLWLEC